MTLTIPLICVLISFYAYSYLVIATFLVVVVVVVWGTLNSFLHDSELFKGRAMSYSLLPLQCQARYWAYSRELKNICSVEYKNVELD